MYLMHRMSRNSRMDHMGHNICMSHNRRMGSAVPLVPCAENGSAPSKAAATGAPGLPAGQGEGLVQGVAAAGAGGIAARAPAPPPPGSTTTVGRRARPEVESVSLLVF